MAMPKKALLEDRIHRPSRIHWAFWFLLGLSFLFLVSLFLLYLDTYTWRSLRTVGNKNDPRWRVFDFHSRQATESEIYSVAEIPAIKKVVETGRRRLRFIFHRPFSRSSWRVIDSQTGTLLHRGRFAEIHFPDSAERRVYKLIPDDISTSKEVLLQIDFYPREKYQAKNLSWPDNYWLVDSTVPLTPKKPHSVAEWVGLASNDPELKKARQLLGQKVDFSLPGLARAEQVFRFVMDALRNSGGTPDDRLQAASPLETYFSLTSGGKGFCENRALVYYLFANAAGIPTRLVDAAGKFGPLKLTGHYFCESYIPEAATWIYVDPQSGIGRAVHRGGKLLHTLDLKKLFDSGATEEIIYLIYDEEKGSLTVQAAQEPNRYFVGDVVLAYPFGYGRAKSYSRIKNFFFYPTLLYAPFPTPRFHRIKSACLLLFFVSLASTAIVGFLCLARRKRAMKLNLSNKKPPLSKNG